MSHKARVSNNILTIRTEVSEIVAAWFPFMIVMSKNVF